MKQDYRIVYSERKTLSIIVERDRSILVRAPKSMSEEEVQQLVDEKKLWLYEKIHHPQKYPPDPVKKEFTTGETILYMGRNYRLELTNEKFDEIRFNSCFFVSRYQKARAGDLFQAWYMERAREKLLPRIRHFAEAMGVSYNRLLISDLKYRWASCTPKNNLNFNWRIIKAPVLVIDYLIVHELAHLLEPNHSPKFWNIIAVQLPEFEKPKKWLKDYGYKLEEDF
ncbi:MAG: M48 family metallopeptidase [Chloroflexi bacterium]|nr:M48 family metallopeptidase [Chloroflexota bacterium]